MIESELCNFCCETPDSLLHRFCTCSIVIVFWREFIFYVFYFFNINITLDAMTVFFGYDLNAKDILLEHLLILAKKYVNNCFINSRRLSISAFISMVTTVRDVERNIAVKNGILEKHQSKWKHYM